MASISCDASGNRTIQFVAADRRRRSIRLGKVPVKTAEEVRRRVEYLAAAVGSGTAPDADTVRWLTSIGDDLHGRLAAVGLVESRARATAGLADFTAAYIAGRPDIKPRTRSNLEICARRLVEYFGAGKVLAEVKPGDADEFCAWLRGRYAQATAARTIKRAKQFFKAAARKRLVTENPFAECKAGHQHNKARAFFVTPEMAAKVLDACPDVQWRVLFALARFGGLRCPSETLSLEWADVDWEKARMRVHSPKQENDESGGERWVPIFPELLPHLREAFEQAEDGAVYVVTRYRDQSVNLRTELNRIIRRAGLETWQRPWHNLRATRQTELSARFPLHVVCYWIGNKEAVAAEHYLQVTDEDFRRGAESGAESGAVAVQNPVQQASAASRTDSQSKQKNPGKQGFLQSAAVACETAQIAQIPPRGLEPLS